MEGGQTRRRKMKKFGRACVDSIVYVCKIREEWQ